MIEEIWRTIPGFPSIYQVSNLGNVKRECIGGEYKVLKRSTSDGYFTVCFESKQFKVHILVAKAFIPNPENRPEVKHKDGNKLNPHVDNLEWAWRSESIEHAIKTGKKKVRLIRCVETGQMFVGTGSVSYYYRLPISAICEALKSNDSCFGKHFEYVDDTDNTLRKDALYLSERTMIKLSKTLEDQDELISHFN